MTHRQSIPRRLLIVTGNVDRSVLDAVRTLPRGSGILLLRPLPAPVVRSIRNHARVRQLTIMSEARGVASRVHDVHQMTRALLERTRIVLLSPIFHTASHPDWTPLPRMRASTLARLAKRRLHALGGMNDRRYGQIAQLGFIGWAGISAFRT